MRLKLLLLLITLLQYNNAKSQTNKEYLYYPTGQIKIIDSLSQCSTIKCREEYHEAIDSVKGDTVLYSSDRGNLKSKGFYHLFEDAWLQRGYWSYWYEDGSLKAEDYYSDDTLGCRYISQYLPNGIQTIVNGQGVLITSEMRFNNLPDSVIYTIKDSLRDGAFEKWRFNKNGTCYLYFKGEYRKNKRQDLCSLYHSNGQLKSLYQKKNSMYNGFWKKFYDNGQIAEKGNYYNNNQTGKWKFWNRNGCLIKECEYKKRKLIGKYSDYFSNNILKSRGEYKHICGIDTLKVRDLRTDETYMKIVDVDNVSVKDGIWYYYNENGELIKTENYDYGVIY